LSQSDRYDQEQDKFSADNGHEFNTVKSGFLAFSHPYEVCFTASGLYYEGPLMVWPGESMAAAVAPMTPQSDVNYYGALAIRETLPIHPMVNLAEILGQILEGSWFPELMKVGDFQNLETFVKVLSSQYVNLEFGFEPFKQDLLSLIKSVKDASKALAQVQRDVAQQIRRRHEFPPESPKETDFNDFDPNLIWPSNSFVDRDGAIMAAVTGGNQRYHESAKVITSRRIWFSGAYVYYFPVVDVLDDILDRVNSIAGVEITPSVLWELAPWSWLADWRFNIGNILSNFSSLSEFNQVLKYGYLMVETTSTTIITYDDVRVSNGSPNGFPSTRYVGSVSSYWTSVRKERFRASPYGFGQDPDGFSTTQWAILLSLGLTETLGVLL